MEVISLRGWLAQYGCDQWKSFYMHTNRVKEHAKSD
ncbi:hypothetical protein PLUTE_b6010 [Pseudoalteromonas luteoviolacea DSM 6061]|nr:hypothetical protein [Pseudoalteromonas luteoviolacea DSM 6061]